MSPVMVAPLGALATLLLVLGPGPQRQGNAAPAQLAAAGSPLAQGAVRSNLQRSVREAVLEAIGSLALVPGLR